MIKESSSPVSMGSPEIWMRFVESDEESRKRVQFARVEEKFLGAGLNFPDFSTRSGVIKEESGLESFKTARWDIFESKGFGEIKIFCLLGSSCRCKQYLFLNTKTMVFCGRVNFGKKKVGVG